MTWALQSIALAACKVFSLLLMAAAKESVGRKDQVNRLQGRSYAWFGK